MQQFIAHAHMQPVLRKRNRHFSDINSLVVLRMYKGRGDRYPDVKVVCIHGFNWRLHANHDTLELAELVYKTAPIDHLSFHFEILFAVFLQIQWDSRLLLFSMSLRSE